MNEPDRGEGVGTILATEVVLAFIALTMPLIPNALKMRAQSRGMVLVLRSQEVPGALTAKFGIDYLEWLSEQY